MFNLHSNNYQEQDELGHVAGKLTVVGPVKYPLLNVLKGAFHHRHPMYEFFTNNHTIPYDNSMGQAKTLQFPFTAPGNTNPAEEHTPCYYHHSLDS